MRALSTLRPQLCGSCAWPCHQTCEPWTFFFSFKFHVFKNHCGSGKSFLVFQTAFCAREARKESTFVQCQKLHWGAVVQLAAYCSRLLDGKSPTEKVCFTSVEPKCFQFGQVARRSSLKVCLGSCWPFPKKAWLGNSKQSRFGQDCTK